MSPRMWAYRISGFRTLFRLFCAFLNLYREYEDNPVYLFVRFELDPHEGSQLGPYGRFCTLNWSMWREFQDFLEVLWFWIWPPWWEELLIHRTVCSRFIHRTVCSRFIHRTVCSRLTDKKNTALIFSFFCDTDLPQQHAAKWNSIWLKIERKTVITIISHSMWKEMET